jgi:uracil-DNA glycosylase
VTELGFFLKESEVAQATTKERRPKKVAVLISEHERGCDACPLQEVWPRITTPQMPMRGNLQGDILVIAEAPGEEEDLGGDVLIGKTGQFLRKHIPHRHKDRLAFTNIVRCRPPGNRTPTGLEMHCCYMHLEEDVRRTAFKAVLLVGGSPLSRFISPATASITQIHGVRFPIEIAGRVMWGFPVFHPSFVERTGGENSTQWPCFNADIQRFFREVDKWRDPVVERVSAGDVIVTRDPAEARAIIERMEGVLGVDVETSRLKPYERDAKLITGAVSDGDTTVAFPCEHPEDPNDWGVPLLLEVTQQRKWVGHQSQFEYTWLTSEARRLDIDWQCAEFDDSMALVRQLVARTGLNGLDVASRIVLGVDIKSLTDVDARNIMAYSLAEVLPYNGLDAWASAKILRRTGKPANQHLYNHFNRASRGFALMELAGLETDQVFAAEQKDKWSKIAMDAEAEAQQIYEAKTFVRERQQEFNIGNNEHVGYALTHYGKIELPKTPSGKSFSTDDAILGPIADKNPLARATLIYREAKKHESTYIDNVRAVPERYPDSLIHPSYTAGMHHHCLRSTSTDPNIQNWPKRRHKEIRGMIRARPGHVLMACDSGQIQARIFGMASKDRALIRSFIDHVDIHNHWLHRAIEAYPPYLDRLREQTNTKDESRLLKAGRDVIKYDFVFASFFGQTAMSCAEKTGIPLGITRELLDEFWGGYPEAYKWLKARRAEYRDTGGVHFLCGQQRYGVMPGNECIITAIQGGEGEFILGALGDLAAASIEEGDPYLLPRICIHDDLTLEVPDTEEAIEYYMGRVTHEMNRIRFPWQIVPLTTEVQVGYSWHDLGKIAELEGDYVR